jgi:hypothetical protein
MNSFNSGLFQGYREITPQELKEIKEVVELFPGLSRMELAHTLCEHLEWRTASGSYKVDACYKLLEKLDNQGSIRLPAKRVYRKRKKEKAPCRSLRTNPGVDIAGKLSDIKPVWLEKVIDKDGRDLWNEYTDSYHYLGYKKPIGCFMRYFIKFGEGLLGCVLLAGAAKSLGVRDRWIGWTDQQRLKNLSFIVNNTRFLIFPWVRVKYLAGHILGQLARQVGQDWHEQWGYRPLLMETFVDPDRFQGICYRAAGWKCLGMTTGEGLRRPGRSYATTPKIIFVRPLVVDFRKQLCDDHLISGGSHE